MRVANGVMERGVKLDVQPALAAARRKRRVAEGNVSRGGALVVEMGGGANNGNFSATSGKGW